MSKAARSRIRVTSSAILLAAAFVQPSCAGAQSAGSDKPAAAQIAEAVAAAPAALRAGATVLGYGGASREEDPLTVIREGSNEMICLADDPAREGFHVACYHQDLDPFMAIGRRAEAAEKSRAEVQSDRYAALESGDLVMPGPAMLFSITADEGAFDAATGQTAGARRLAVVYVPNATPEEIGLPAQPEGNTPWLMLPGTPWAHIMISR